MGLAPDDVSPQGPLLRTGFHEDAPQERTPTLMNNLRLLHVATVPQTLGFLRGQVSDMKRRGFEVHAVSSPGVELGAFATREGVPVHAVRMTRRITPLSDLVVNPSRPNRLEPRVLKRRMKEYTLMKKPRRELRKALQRKKDAA